MTLLVVITSYRAKQLTLDCLHSLAGEARENSDMRVGICDNGNEDDTADFLNRAIRENGWRQWCFLRTVQPNRGFSGGNNVIVREALTSAEPPEYVLLLNADTIVSPGTIRRLLDAARQRRDVGIFGPCLVDAAGTPQVSCFRYIRPLGELIRAARTGPVTRLLARWEVPMRPLPEHQFEPDWVCFACALIRGKVFQDIGVLDDGYFLYFDDVDYCRSARQRGWKVLYLPDIRVAHLEGQSNVVPQYTRERKRRPAYWYVSRSWYFTKFHGKSGLLLANVLWLAGRTIALLREIFGTKEPHLCDREWRDIWIGFQVKVTSATTAISPEYPAAGQPAAVGRSGGCCP